LSLSETEKVTDAIYGLPPSNLFNCSTLETIILLNISDHLILGRLSILCFNSSGIDNVTVAIFVSTDYVSKRKYVDIYKSFGLDVDNLIQDSESSSLRFKDQESESSSCKENITPSSIKDINNKPTLLLTFLFSSYS